MSLLQRIYTPIYNVGGGNQALLSIFGSNVVTFGSFWCINALLLAIDVTGSPKWLLKYKVQEYKPLDPGKLKKAVKMALMNTVVWNILLAGPVTWWLQVAQGCDFRPEQIPSYFRILIDFVVFTIVQEIIFYYSHRLLHHPFLYKHVHKVHHEWTAPIGIVAIYAHPLEYLTSNALTILVGPVLMRSHLAVFWLWYIVATSVTVIHHSGYHFPFLPSPQFHDYHHLKFVWNFGTLGILDSLHGTDKAFRDDVASERHRWLTGFTPISQLYPDKSTKK